MPQWAAAQVRRCCTGREGWHTLITGGPGLSRRLALADSGMVSAISRLSRPLRRPGWSGHGTSCAEHAIRDRRYPSLPAGNQSRDMRGMTAAQASPDSVLPQLRRQLSSEANPGLDNRCGVPAACPIRGARLRVRAVSRGQLYRLAPGGRPGTTDPRDDLVRKRSTDPPQTMPGLPSE
jgi:hypothetical protein